MFRTAVIAVCSLLGMSLAYAGEERPPGADEHLSGPAIVGTLTLTDAEGDFLQATISGTCRGENVVLTTSSPIPGTIAEVTAGALEGRGLGQNSVSLVPQCGYRSSGDLVINTVTHLTKTETVAIADVVILAIVPKGNN